MREWIVRISLAILGFAAASVMFSAGCAQKLGTMEIDTAGDFSGLMYKNCGCGCTAIVDIDADDQFNAAGKESIEQEHSININANIPRK